MPQTTSDFNPRSHERSDCPTQCQLLLHQISIHAPTRGATDACVVITGVGSISIHAPTRGATDYVAATEEDMEFQSTLPREERQNREAYKNGKVQFQSTLPREERRKLLVIICSGIQYFNPRSHERSDGIWYRARHTPFPISIHAPTRGATPILHKKFVYFYTIPTINI